MATLLTMLNELRLLLQEEQVTSISATDDLTQALIPLINNASWAVTESRTWSFDKRYDGEADIPGLVTGTSVVHSVGPPSVISVEYTADALAMFTSNNVSVRFRLSNDTVRPGLSYRVVSGVRFVSLIVMTLTPDWLGEQALNTTDGTWTLYATDAILPSTVRKVLSVRDEEQPLQLHFTEDEIFTDRASPRTLDDTGEPSCAIVGGIETTSPELLPSAVAGMRMRVLPVPVSDTMLYYTYVYRHPEMTAATDTLVAVPDQVINLITDLAFYYCLISNIQADTVRAKQVMRQLRIDTEVAIRDDQKAPNRRRILNPSGSVFHRHPNSRWDTREVPSP